MTKKAKIKPKEKEFEVEFRRQVEQRVTVMVLAKDEDEALNKARSGDYIYEDYYHIDVDDEYDFRVVDDFGDDGEDENEED